MRGHDSFERVIPSEKRYASIRRLSSLLHDFLPGKNLRVRVDVKRNERSDLQNRALWGCAYRALREQTGNDPEDLHTFFCGEWFGWQEYDVMGQPRKRPIRTTTRDESGTRDVINTALMSEFYDFIQRRSAQAGYDVPDPDENWWKET